MAISWRVFVTFRWADLPGPGRIAIRPRPSGGAQLDGSVGAIAARGTNVLVSLLCEDEAEALGLADERAAAERAGMRFVQFPIVDHSIPTSVEDTVRVADELAAAYTSGDAIVLHCFAGIGRSALMAIATLVRAGVPLEEAAVRLSEARGLRVPETAQQWAFLQEVDQTP